MKQTVIQHNVQLGKLVHQAELAAFMFVPQVSSVVIFPNGKNWRVGDWQFGQDTFKFCRNRI